MADKDIPTLRDEIDRIDREIVCLLKERVEITMNVGQLKADKSMAVEDIDRELEVFKNVSAIAGESGLDEEFVREIFRAIAKAIEKFHK